MMMIDDDGGGDDDDNDDADHDDEDDDDDDDDEDDDYDDDDADDDDDDDDDDKFSVRCIFIVSCATRGPGMIFIVFKNLQSAPLSDLLIYTPNTTTVIQITLQQF